MAIYIDIYPKDQLRLSCHYYGGWTVLNSVPYKLARMWHQIFLDMYRGGDNGTNKKKTLVLCFVKESDRQIEVTLEKINILVQVLSLSLSLWFPFGKR